MIYFVICASVITVFAILLCVFSGRQQRKEDVYFDRQDVGDWFESRVDSEADREDWDLLNNWDEEK